MAAVGPWDVHLLGHFPDEHMTTFKLPFPVLNPPCGKHIMFSPNPHHFSLAHCVRIVHPSPCATRAPPAVMGGGDWCCCR